MSKARKTAEVKEILNWSNVQLARKDEFATVDFKIGICTSLEMVLMTTGNYNGYSHLDNEDCEFGTMGYFSRKYF